MTQIMELLGVNDPFIRIMVLIELRTRALHLLKPPMNALSPYFENTEVKWYSDSVINARAFLSRRCIYLYSMAESGITCTRLEPRGMTICVKGECVVFRSYGMKSQADEAVLEFVDKEKMKSWLSVIRAESVETNREVECRIASLLECNQVRKRIPSIIIHPVLYVLSEKELNDICAVLEKKNDVMNDQAKQLMSDLLLINDVVQQKTDEETVRQFLIRNEKDHDGICVTEYA